MMPSATQVHDDQEYLTAQDEAITETSTSDGLYTDNALCLIHNEAQYWKELSGSLNCYPRFEGTNRPQDIISRLNDLISEAEGLGRKNKVYDVLMEQKDQQIQEKDATISKLQNRNSSLADMLQDQLNQGRESSGGLHRGSMQSTSSAGSGISLSATNGEKRDQKEVADLEKRYSQLLESKNTLYGHWKTVGSERDTYKNKFEAAQSECNELKQQITMFEGGQPSGNMSNTATGDKEVVLKRDEDGRCGIRFGCPKKAPLLMESNTIIIDVRPGIYNHSKLGIGDFVIEVNGFNTQWRKLREVLELVNTSGDLKLKLRPSRHNITKIEMTVSGQKSLVDWGLKLGVYVKETKSGALADTSGMREMDELIRVNSHDVNDLSLKKIYSSMSKEVKFRIQKLQCPYDTYEHFSSPPSVKSDESDRMSVSSQNLPSSDIPPAIPLGIHRPSLINVDDVLSSSSGRSSNRSNHSNDAKRDSLLPSGLVSDITTSPSSGGESDDPQLSPQSSGGPSSDGLESTDSDIVTRDVKKCDYEAFGWNLIGGNKVGIYVKAIDNWSPIEKAQIEVGWKILQVNDTSLENVVFSFTMEFMASLRQATSMKVKLEKTTREYYSAQISKKPYDNFHIRTLVDYKKKSSDESSFKSNEVYCVTDSYYINENNNTLKWVAKNTATSQTVTIPSQRANFILAEEETYSSRDKRTMPVRYYVILDKKVDIQGKKGHEDEDEGAF